MPEPGVSEVEPLAPSLRAAICAIAKDEGPYLAEWVVYHHLIGFDPILVYDHESRDDTANVLAVLEAAGLCERVPWTAPTGTKPQWLAYEDGLARLRSRTDWIAFIDLDEFLVLTEADSVQALLAGRASTEALGVNWKMFGSAGQEAHGPGLVMERFTRCAKTSFRGNRAVKTVVHVDAVDVPRVHTCRFVPGVRYLSAGGEEIPPGEGQTELVVHEPVRLNHYFTKSRAEWDVKARRGRGAKPVGHPLKHRQPHEFEANDRNEQEDTTILRWAGQVRERMAQLGLATKSPDGSGPASAH